LCQQGSAALLASMPVEKRPPQDGVRTSRLHNPERQSLSGLQQLWQIYLIIKKTPYSKRLINIPVRFVFSA
jgi:hypothetical protein